MMHQWHLHWWDLCYWKSILLVLWTHFLLISRARDSILVQPFLFQAVTVLQMCCVVVSIVQFMLLDLWLCCNIAARWDVLYWVSPCLCIYRKRWKAVSVVLLSQNMFNDHPDHPPITDRNHWIGCVFILTIHFELNIVPRVGVRFQTYSRLLHLQRWSHMLVLHQCSPATTDTLNKIL